VEKKVAGGELDRVGFLTKKICRIHWWRFVSERYKGKTSIIITVDHGRGSTPQDWTDHGEKVPEAQYIWMAFISPDSALRGEWRNTETIYQNQVAATLCRFLNQNYVENNPSAGKPIGAPLKM